MHRTYLILPAVHWRYLFSTDRPYSEHVRTYPALALLPASDPTCPILAVLSTQLMNGLHGRLNSDTECLKLLRGEEVSRVGLHALDERPPHPGEQIIKYSNYRKILSVVGFDLE